MSYSIVYETKIVKLSDGRLIHFHRHGCNNDTSGRKKSDFEAEVFTFDAFLNKCEKYMAGSEPYNGNNDWDLKIGSRLATIYDYGAHLKRMMIRGLQYADFVNKYYVHASHLKGIELIKPFHQIMSVEEFDKISSELMYNGGYTYRRILEYPNIFDEDNIVSLIEKGEPISFEIKSI